MTQAKSNPTPNRLDLDDPQHRAVRSLLRVVGPSILLVGLAFTIVGVTSFFQAFGSMGDPGGDHFPHYFWCAFVGLPMVWLGGVLSLPAFLGVVSRYMSKEMVPVHREVFNTMAEGTTDGIRTIAQAIGEGLAAGRPQAAGSTYCPGCGSAIPGLARFCPGCGKAI